MPCVCLLLVAQALQAATPACDALFEADRAHAAALMQRVFIHDCCDEPLAACLVQRPRCRLADRLADDLCARVAQGQTDVRIRQALTERAWTALPAGGPARIDLSEAPMAGDPAAPVAVVVYASPRGVHCSRLVPGVVDAVTQGSLRGRVRLYVRLFPLRSNEHDTEAGLALMAAQRLGAFWDLALLGYARFDAFSLEAQRAWARELGLDPAEVDRLAADPGLLDLLRAGKREGVELGVTSTPTFFIDGHRYRGELELPELLDTLAEAWERAAGLTWAEEDP